MIDGVYHPEHYSRWPMEPIEFIAVNNLPWWLTNVVKYCMRFDAKDGIKDLYKARSYLDMKIRQLEGHPKFWKNPVSEERLLDDKPFQRLEVFPFDDPAPSKQFDTIAEYQERMYKERMMDQKAFNGSSQ